ncbi:MAG: alpha/beta fold hydrolase, partial [Deltaproteobacteria bacterium]|nr:alpha/beta fold hydrolase [Deltaproteobacteria bacterium]
MHGRDLGEASVLVFAHGAGGNHLSWWQQVPHFAPRFTVVTFDHRGFGQSAEAASGTGGAAFVDDLHALLDHLGIERCTLISQSMGGWTCLGFTIRHPQRVERLVLCDTHGGLVSEAIAAAWASSFHSAEHATVHPAAGERMAREQPALHFLYEQINGLNTGHSLEELTALLASAGAPTPEDVKHLGLPVLFITGDEDIVIPPHVIEIAATYFADARVE